MLDVQNLSIYVQQEKKEQQVVQELSFRIPQGRVIGIVGESGSGKSMICTTILRLYQGGRRVEGEILYKGKSLLNLSNKELRALRGKELALIMQNPMSMFNPLLTIGDHYIETVLAHSNRSKKEARLLAYDQLERFQLSGEQVLNKYPHELSGGMLQRIMIAMAVCHQPSLLIADEPTTALDTMTQLLILEELEAYQQASGASMIMVSHDLGVIARLSDDIMVMRSGMMVEYGPADQLLANPRHPYTQALLAVKQPHRSLDELADNYGEPITGSLVESQPGYWVRVQH